MGKFGWFVFLRLTVDDAGIADVTEGGSLDDVANDEALDRFVLGHTTTAVGAPNGFHVTTTLLRTSAVPPLESHCGLFFLIEEGNETKGKEKKNDDVKRKRIITS